jgi:HSP20 family molecular chaperone IbpA
MFFVNDPGPWQSFILRGDNVGRPINEVTQKYLHEQLQFENFISMEQQLQLQQYQNKGLLISNEIPFTFTFEINVENEGDNFRVNISTTEVGPTDIIIDWGDGSPLTSGSIEQLSQETYNYSYSSAGNYIVGVIATEPSNIYSVTADQND